MKFQSYGTSMTIVLPNQLDDLQFIIKKISDDPLLLEHLRKTFEFKVVDLYLPRFQIKSDDLDITDLLQQVCYLFLS